MIRFTETEMFPHEDNCASMVQPTGDIETAGDYHYEGYECPKCGRYAELILKPDGWFRSIDSEDH